MKKIILLCIFIVVGIASYAQNGINDRLYIFKYTNCAFYCEDGVLFTKNRSDYTKSGSILIKYPQSKTSISYTIPDWVVTIAKGAFKGNDFIETINIPSSVEYIGDEAFDDCKSLKSIQMYESTSAARAVEYEESNSQA